MEQNNLESKNYYEIKDDSHTILNGLMPYIHLFITEICYYEDAYGLFLKEIKDPFRIISIFHYFDSNFFEIRSEITNFLNTQQILYDKNDIKTIEECIKIVSKVILGYDLIFKLDKKFQNIKSQ